MPTNVEIFTEGEGPAERVTLESTSKFEMSYFTGTKPTYQLTSVQTQTQEFPSVADLVEENNRERRGSSYRAAIGTSILVALALKGAEQISQAATGSYAGNPWVDAGVDLGALIGGAKAFQSGLRGIFQTNRVSAKLNQLTNQGVNSILPRRDQLR